MQTLGVIMIVLGAGIIVVVVIKYFLQAKSSH